MGKTARLDSSKAMMAAALNVVRTSERALGKIVCETDTHWATEIRPGYFEVYKIGLTHSVRCARIGPFPESGTARDRAILECRRRSAVAQTAQEVAT